MLVNGVVKRILPFSLAVLSGLMGFYTSRSPSSYTVPFHEVIDTGGSGSASCSDGSDRWSLPGSLGEDVPESSSDNLNSRGFRILAKPKATYTNAARENEVEGNVLLKVTLLASGQVGSITPIKTLPDGLTEQAIAAAGKIKFEPKRIKGIPVTVIVTFDYSFRLY